MKHDISQELINQYGFTLIELMISLVLGLLISAAVMQVFLTSQRVDRIQTAGSEIQDKAVFGLQNIESQVRLANLGNDGIAINDTTANGGIVLTIGNKNATGVNVAIKSGNKATNYVTRAIDVSNTDKDSDQLTIQYINTTGRTLFDCEGREVEENEHVIARYFLADAGGTGRGARKNLNLYCDAGRIDNNKAINFAGDGETVIENLDQFNIRLGVQHSVVNNGNISYQYADMSVEDYMNLSSKPPITNIKIAILARSTANSPEASGDKFDIFGVEQTLKSQDDAPNHLRRVYETNILLRNARIMRVFDGSSVS